jgi:hypothetical protein
MSLLMRTLALSVPLTALLMLPLPAGAQSSDQAWPSSGPNCAPTRDDMSLGEVWLGHFSGGTALRNGNETSALDWHDDDMCFTSRKACNAWLAEMRKSMPVVEGWKACLPIR